MKGFSAPRSFGEKGMIEVLGEGGGNLFWDGAPQHLILHREGKDAECLRFEEGGDDVWESEISYYSCGHARQVRHFGGLSADGASPRYGGGDGLRAVRCTLAAIKSAENRVPSRSPRWRRNTGPSRGDGRTAMHKRGDPDFRQLLKVLRREGRPAWVPAYEHLASSGFIARSTGTAFDRMRADDPAYWRIYVGFLDRLGFDCIPMESGARLPLAGTRPRPDGRKRVQRRIHNREDYERYPWPPAIASHRVPLF